MAVGCKLWLLAVVCVTFLYQDGLHGNGVLCGRKPAPESTEDHSSGAVSSDDGNDGYNDYSDQNDSCNASDGDHTDNNHNGSSDDDDYEGDNGDDADKGTDSDEEEDHGNNTKKHATNKNSVSCKNHNRHHDEDEDEDGEDNEGDEDEKADEDEEDDKEHIEHYKKSTRNNTKKTEMKIYKTTIITGKPKDILKFVNEGVKPYKPATLDFSKKSNSSLLKKIDTILNRSSLLSKNKKETSEEDLTHYMRHVVEEGLKKKSSKQIDADKLLITLVKGVLLQLLKAV